jgi:hypothetical protein
VTLPAQGDDELRRLEMSRSFDDAGRVVHVEQDGGGYRRSSANGEPELSWDWSYDPYGGYYLDYRDYSTDAVNATCNGRPCARVLLTFTAGCTQIVEQIGASEPPGCYFDRPRTVRLWAPAIHQGGAGVFDLIRVGLP